ncbi:MAG TPA: hypothetical protein VGS99_01765, partial [Gammaproteobacteria bacterium]|nr:hypothetical protein [Gammaproteobacteria bacterium]
MNTAATPLQSYADGFAVLPRAPARLQSLREAALQRAIAKGFPGSRDEAWKYTSTAALERRGFMPATVPAQLDPAAIAAAVIPSLDAWRLVFVNGRYQSGLSSLPDHIQARTLDTNSPSTLSAPADWEQDTFFNLNTALFQDGLMLEVAAASRDERPVELLHLIVPQERPSAHHPRCVVQLGPQARCLLIERYVGAADV